MWTQDQESLGSSTGLRMKFLCFGQGRSYGSNSSRYTRWYLDIVSNVQKAVSGGNVVKGQYFHIPGKSGRSNRDEKKGNRAGPRGKGTEVLTGVCVGETSNFQVVPSRRHTRGISTHQRTWL